MRSCARIRKVALSSVNIFYQLYTCRRRLPRFESNMPSFTHLLEARVSPIVATDADSFLRMQEKLKEVLRGHEFSKLHTMSPDGAKQCFILQAIRQDACDVVIRCGPNGLITIDLHEFRDEGAETVFTEELLNNLMEDVKAACQSISCRRLPAIRRGCAFNCYFPTTDNKLIEYDFERCVYEADSPFQNIKVMKSSQFGNMLILDDDPNLAESDLVYTQAITGRGREDYRDKTVLVLGGGDGGILRELLKEEPKFITVVDIDKLVVDAARLHLRGICGDALDKLEGENYKVLLEDCVPILEEYIKEGRIFDYVINDLTAVPVTTEPVGDLWDFLRLILDHSMKVLSTTGRYFTQGNGANMKQALAMYEQQLASLQTPVDFRREDVYVPSYHELWAFYEVWKQLPSAL